MNKVFLWLDKLWQHFGPKGPRLSKYNSWHTISYKVSYFHFVWTMVTAFDTSVHNIHLPGGCIIITKLLEEGGILLHVCSLGNGIYVPKLTLHYYILQCWLANMQPQWSANDVSATTWPAAPLYVNMGMWLESGPAYHIKCDHGWLQAFLCHMYCSWSWAEKHILIEGRPRCYTKSLTMQKWSSNWSWLASSHMYCSWALTSRPRRYTWSPTVWDMFSTNTRPHQLCWGDWKMGTVISCENCCKMAGYCGVGTALRLCDSQKVLVWAVVTNITFVKMQNCVLPQCIH